MNPIVDQFLALIIHAQNPLDFAFFPYTTNPFLTYIIAFLPHLLSFYFLLKSLLRGLYYAFVRDPLTQWCSMMTKVVWVFILTSLAWNEISQKPEGGGGRLTVDYLAQKTYIINIIWYCPTPTFGYATFARQGWLLLANILASQLAPLLTYKKSGTS